MGKTIAVTGKGGVGKTTLSAMILQWLVANNETPVLAVDADSNANLHETLGIEYDATVGGIREDALEKAKEMTGVSKQEFLDMQVQSALVEKDGYDLIVMGRPEGPGCYCFANNVLRDVIDKLSKNYKHIVVDSEAGIEHISRRTLLKVDYLFTVSDCTVRGIRTAKRIADLADEMKTPVSHRGLIVNRVPNGILPEGVNDAIDELGLNLMAVIPFDDNVAEFDSGGMALVDIPSDSLARNEIGKLLSSIINE
ncbi:MAG: AAA family ATPase [Armatimonadota bacterium]